MSLSQLSTLNSQLSNCVLCGTCRGVCPTFDVARREPASARGKVALCDALLKKEINISGGFIKHMTECVQCMACYESCPNDVNVPDIVLAARREIVKENGLPFIKSLMLRNFLDSERLMPAVMKFASNLQSLFFKGVPEESGLHRRFPLPLVDERRLMPPLADRFFLESVKESGECRVESVEQKIGSLGRSRYLNSQLSTLNSPKVGFFAGCLINYMLPNIGEASLKLIEKAGASVIVPPDQHCCGMPALGMGDVETAKSLALKNLEAFEQYKLDYITTACATCGDGLRRRFKELLGDEYPERVNAFCSKVRDITELLVRELRVGSGEWRKGHTSLGSKLSAPGSVITYHDPCHLNRGQGIKDAPRELIEISGARFKEMSHPCRCCGLGGSFNITDYDFSMEIARSKAEDIKNTGADIVATACPGCMIQIKDGLHQIGVKTKVLHVVELLV